MDTFKLENNLGKQGKDIITGYEGIITGFIKYFYGCEQYLLIQKIKKDGKRHDGEWFDIARIKINGKKIKLQKISKEIKGAEINFEKYPNSN